MDAEELLVAAEHPRRARARVLEQARALVAQAPFRERRWVLLATALHQSGRQAEALGAVKRARTMLADELGLDPGRELAELEELLLAAGPVAAIPPRGAHGQRVSARTGGCCRTAPRTRTPSSAARTTSRPVCGGCVTRSVLAVVGPSGIGKSSLVLAGVVAALTRAGTTGPRDHARSATL